MSRRRARVHLGVGGEQRQRARPEQHPQSEADDQGGHERAERRPPQEVDSPQRAAQPFPLQGPREEQPAQEEGHEREEISQLIDQRLAEGQLRVPRSGP